jgi:hypothetical protein
MPIRQAMQQKALFTTVLAGLALSGFAAAAAPSPSSPSAAGVQLEICRLPGSLSEYSGKEVDIPAGTTFAEDLFQEDDGVLPAASQPSVRVVTTAPVALAASAFCVRAPVRPLAPAAAAALQASFGRMFVVAGKRAHGASGVLDRIYGLLQSSSG